MKYIASMDGNGCLLLYMSSTTAGKFENLRTSEQLNQLFFNNWLQGEGGNRERGTKPTN
jgi:hypothetical protein